MLETRTRLLGPKHHLTGVVCSCLGVVYEHLGQSADAIKFASQTLDITKEGVGEHHPNYASSLDNLAVLYRENGDYAKAEPLCLKALQIRKELLGVKRPQLCPQSEQSGLALRIVGQLRQGRAAPS